MELMVFLLQRNVYVEIGINAARLSKLLLLIITAVSYTFMLSGLTKDVVQLMLLVRMGYEKPSTKLTFYKAFFLAQWKFLIYTIVQCMSAKRTAWNIFSSSMASAVICLATEKDEADNEVPAAPSLPTPATTSLPQQEPIPSPP
nr:ribonuclease H-like domain, reverse transcriptase, RNA-dependent DNA polymerase [Tanacetum cinerariifolium]